MSTKLFVTNSEQVVSRVAVNTTTSGKFRREKINNRDHIILAMMPIAGDSVMNKVMYPLDEVTTSHSQLHNLPAPAGHPKLNGKHVSAFHPLAINAHNVGGVVRNPRMEGKKVYADFCLDVEVANSKEDGRTLIERIESGKPVGVSTGLTVTPIPATNAEAEINGTQYSAVATELNFDHVAILLNEKAAGAHEGTELITNEDGELTVITLVNEIGVNDVREQITEIAELANPGNWVYVVDMFMDPDYAIIEIEPREGGESRMEKQNFSVTDEKVQFDGQPIKVERKVDFVEMSNAQETEDMDKKLLVLALIANSEQHNMGDFDKLMAMSEADLAKAAVYTNTVEVKVNAEEPELITMLEEKGYKVLNSEQSEKFTKLEEAEEAALAKMRDSIVANSDYTVEELKGKASAELTKLNALVTNKQKAPVYSLNNQGGTNSDSSNVSFGKPDYSQGAK